MSSINAQQLTSEWTDEEIIAQVLAGDTDQYEVLVRRHTARLFRAVTSIVGPTDAEDVVQDAFVAAFKYLAQFAGRAKFSTWLTRIAVHRALEVTQGRREQSLDVPEMDYSSILRAHGRSPEQQAAMREARTLVQDAVAQLPEIYREVVVMRCLQETDTAETATALKISQSNVKVRLHRACSMMRRHLEGAIGGETAARAMATA